MWYLVELLPLVPGQNLVCVYQKSRLEKLRRGKALISDFGS